jgi:hypothetical protein
MKILVCGEGRKMKRRFPNPTYIHRLTDEYRWAHNGSPAPHIYMGPIKVKPDTHIFIGSRPKPMNINLFSPVPKLMNVI